MAVRVAHATPMGVGDTGPGSVRIAPPGQQPGPPAAGEALPTGVTQFAAEGEGLLLEVVEGVERLGSGQADLGPYGQRKRQERLPSIDPAASDATGRGDTARQARTAQPLRPLGPAEGTPPAVTQGAPGSRTSITGRTPTARLWWHIPSHAASHGTGRNWGPKPTHIDHQEPCRWSR